MSETVEMAARRVPLMGQWDVIVLGGGPSGCMAAIAASETGARTLLIEATGSLGGMATSGRVPHWHGSTNGGGFLPGQGLSRKTLERLQAEMPVESPLPSGWAIDCETLKRVYDDMVAESGAQALLETTLASCDARDGRVDTVYAVNKAGLCAYRAKAFLDCTGDADLVAMAGGEWVMGDEDGGTQAATLCFLLTGFTENRFDFTTRMNLTIDETKCPDLKDKRGTYARVADGAYGMNAGHVMGVEPLDPVSRSDALRIGRRIARQFRDSVRETYPDIAGNVMLAATASSLGVRESRRIVGDYVLTEADYRARRDFPDEICRNCAGFDSHPTKREAEILASGGTLPCKNEEYVYESGESHGIPYRCLLPKGLANVAVAGRTLSAERRVMGSCRMMTVCMTMGEAMGVAARMALAKDGDFRAVNTDALRDTLRARGAFFH